MRTTVVQECHHDWAENQETTRQAVVFLEEYAAWKKCILGLEDVKIVDLELSRLVADRSSFLSPASGRKQGRQVPIWPETDTGTQTGEVQPEGRVSGVCVEQTAMVAYCVPV